MQWGVLQINNEDKINKKIHALKLQFKFSILNGSLVPGSTRSVTWAVKVKIITCACFLYSLPVHNNVLHVIFFILKGHGIFIF